MTSNISNPTLPNTIDTVVKAVDAIRDSMLPGETVRMGDFRRAVISLCPGVTGENITAGILNSINDSRFVLEGLAYLRLPADWDNRLSGYHEDDRRWTRSLSQSRMPRRVL